MSDVSVDIHIYPQKELTSRDMAELMETTIPDHSGIVHGCEVTLSNGVLTVSSGRVVIRGRLGVVTGGTVPLPTLSAREKCTLVVVCDLSAETPFYISLVNDAGYNDLESAAVPVDDYETFNSTNGLDFFNLGTCYVDPATNRVSDWSAYDVNTLKRWHSGLIDEMNHYMEVERNRFKWKAVRDTDVKAGTWVTIPDSANEIYVAVFIVWDTARKVCVDFHVPTVNALFNLGSGQTQTYHVNHWGATYDGYVRIATMRDTIPHKYVKVLEAYNGETDVTSSTYCRVFYR